MFVADYYDLFDSFDGISRISRASSTCSILAIISAIVLFIVFLPERNESRYHGFTLWLHKFFNFKKMLSMYLLKFLYLLATCFITFLGIYSIFQEFLVGLLILFVGNLVLRLIYEFLVLIFSIHDNLCQINSNTKKLDGSRNQEIIRKPVNGYSANQNPLNSNVQVQNPQPAQPQNDQQQPQNDQQQPQNDQQQNQSL